MVFLVLAFGRMVEGESTSAGQGRLQIGLVGAEIGVWVGMVLIGGRTDGGWLQSIGWLWDGSLAAEMTFGSIWIRWVAIGSVDLRWFGGRGLGTKGGRLWLCLGLGLEVM